MRYHESSGDGNGRRHDLSRPALPARARRSDVSRRRFGSIRPDVEVDVTRQLIYGVDNTFSPAESMGALLDPVAFNLAGIELRLYPKAQYEKFASVGGWQSRRRHAPPICLKAR